MKTKTLFLLSVLCLFGKGKSSDAQKESSQAVQATCVTSARDFAEAFAEVICPHDCLASSKSVWGTDVYTDDSSICKAAIHAGLLDNNGGVVVVAKVPGQASYSGSTKNGITTSSYGAWPGSFIFSNASIPMTTTTKTTVTRKPTVQATCSTKARDLTGTSAEVLCPRDCLTSRKRIWGTDVYTDDSYVCQAAIHAGLLDNNGGVVVVEKTPGQASYSGSTRNGITTSSYGAWPGSFILSASIPMTTATKTSTQKPTVQATCSTTARDLAGSSAKVYCPHDCLASGKRVWGTDVYTDDSHICQAAIHAGLLDANGGLVSIEKMPGQASYNGSTRNGITTSSYGGWPGSFIFWKASKPMTTTPKTLATLKPSVQATCSTTGQHLMESFAEVNCPGGCFTADIRVWGTDVYTDDSCVCQAAIHAGLLDNNGGLVSVEKIFGQDSYRGSTRNGITSSSYGTWAASFRFSNTSIPMTTPPTTAATEKTAVPAKCSTSARNMTGSSAEVNCPPGCLASEWGVWGTDIYTDDSSVCKAAIHAGLLDDNGGVVSVRKMPGQTRYSGSTRNGIKTYSDGTWSGSFTFLNGSLLTNTIPTTASIQNTAVRVACSTTARDIAASSAVILCPYECFTIKKSVWGTEIYTEASEICAAAIHAGKIDNNGGVVTIQKAPGQDSYQGSSKNGITTESFGISPGSFTFY